MSSYKTTHINITKKTITELNELFESCPPARLRKSVQTLLFQFLRGIHNLEGNELQNTMTDIYYLIEFLENVEAEDVK